MKIMTRRRLIRACNRLPMDIANMVQILLVIGAAYLLAPLATDVLQRALLAWGSR